MIIYIMKSSSVQGECYPQRLKAKVDNTRQDLQNSSYYMEESVLLGTKPLVDSTRHFILDPSGVFSVCHLCECCIVQ